MAKASDAVALVRRVLQDYQADRYSDDTILSMVNAGRRALGVALPKTYTASVPLTFVDGPRQTTPDDCNVFYGLTSVYYGPGDYGQAVTVTEVEYLDALIPGWRSSSPDEPVHFMFDERKPNEYEVYPPAIAGDKALGSYSQIPADLPSGGDLNSIEAQLVVPISDYAIARLLLEDAESPANASRGAMHMQLFASATGADLKSLLINSPNTANLGGRVPKVATGS